MPPERLRSILKASIDEAQALGVDTLVTIYHACHRELIPPAIAPDAETAFGPIRVENYLTIVARALRLPEHIDRYRHFVELGDPQQIMAELGPRVAELQRLAAEAGRERVPVTYFGLRDPDAAKLDKLAAAGVDRVLLMVAPGTREETLPVLERYAALAATA
jgi:hypothetical protein